MRKIDNLMEVYGQSHQNSTNKIIHWICIPSILFSFTGLIMQIPFIYGQTTFLNWAFVILLLSFFYYLRLSVVLALGFAIIGIALLEGNQILANYCLVTEIKAIYVLSGIFIMAWIGQFIGHKIEGKKPSFFQDVQFLLIGPAWLMVHAFKRFGIRY